jgi:hypothetical protein
MVWPPLGGIPQTVWVQEGEGGEVDGGAAGGGVLA